MRTSPHPAPELPRIALPRGLLHFSGTAPSVLSGLLAMLFLSGWLWHQSLDLFEGWHTLTAALAAIFGAPLSVVLSNQGALAVGVTVPPYNFDMGQSVWLVLGASLVLFVAGATRGASQVPARYALITLAVVLALPCLGYLGGGRGAEFYLSGHLANVFSVGFWFVVAAPLLFGALGFVLPGNVLRKATVAVLATLYLYLTVPVLALLHYHLVLLMGPAITPALNTFGTVFVLCFQFISFYGVLAALR